MKNFAIRIAMTGIVYLLIGFASICTAQTPDELMKKIMIAVEKNDGASGFWVGFFMALDRLAA